MQKCALCCILVSHTASCNPWNTGRIDGKMHDSHHVAFWWHAPFWPQQCKIAAWSPPCYAQWLHWDPHHQQLQQSHHFELTLKGNRVRHAPTDTVEAKNCAGQSGLNWPCFDQMLEVPTSSTFLSTLQFSKRLCHWEGLMELQWQGGRQNAKNTHNVHDTSKCVWCIALCTPDHWCAHDAVTASQIATRCT